jgi:hypothetical protein
MMKPLLKALGLAFLALGLSSPALAGNFDQLAAKMAAFDQAYIPALMLTKTGPQASAQKALDDALKIWAEIKTASPKSVDGEWKKDFDLVDQALADGDAAIKENDLFASHSELEIIRLALLELRTRHKIPFYLDHLNRFHEVMEPISHLGEMKPEELDQAKAAELKKLLQEARSTWPTDPPTKGDPCFASLNPKKLAQLGTALKAGSANLDKLEKALAQGDNKAILMAAKKTKPFYAKAFKLFGDFAKYK